MKTLLLVLSVAAAGCSAVQPLLPNTVAPEFEHISHVSQHAPMTATPTHYGANILSVTANWDIGSHVYVTLAEGISLDHCRPETKYYSTDCGEIVGPREQFTARIGYKFNVK